MSNVGIVDSALAGLQIAQAGMLSTSQNVAGSSVDGYVRRRPDVRVSALAPNSTIALGSSFAVEGFSRFFSSFVQDQLLEQKAKTGYFSVLTASVETIDSLLVDPSNSIATAIGNFFNSSGSLSSEPTNVTYQQQFLSTANIVVDRIVNLSNESERIRKNASVGLADALNQANLKAQYLADVNSQIKIASVPGTSYPSADLLDQRDALVEELQTIVGGSSIINEDGTASVEIGGVLLVDRQFANKFTDGNGLSPLPSTIAPESVRIKLGARPDNNSRLVNLILPGNVNDHVNKSFFDLGKVGAYVELYTNFTSELDRKLNIFSQMLVDEVNSIESNLGVKINPIFGFANALSDKTAAGVFSGVESFQEIIDKTNKNSNSYDHTLYLKVMDSTLGAGLLKVVAPNDAATFGSIDSVAASSLSSLREKFSPAIISFTTSTASKISEWKNNSEAAIAVEESIVSQKNSISGVNLDEEASNLVKYQRLYSASAKVLQATSQMFDTLLLMLSGR